MSWYRTGTVSVVRNSTTVTGSGTSFAANSRVGDGFKGPDGREYEVTNIASASVLSILPAYIGDTLTGGSYAITPIQGYNKDTADALRAVSQSFVDVTESAESAAESAAAAREDRITVGLAATQVGLDRTAAEQAAEAAGESEGIATQGANTASQAAISAEQFRQAAEQSAIDAARSAEEAENASGGPSNTDQLREGETNKYWTGARTLGTALAGLVLDSAAVIAATDTVLSGLGKLQAQISAHVGKRGIAQHPVSNTVEAGFMPVFPSITDGKTYGFKNGVLVEVESGGNAAIFGEIKTLPSRTFNAAGVILGDGQLLSNAAAQYPDAWAALQLATPPVPVTTTALWLSDPAKRGCWAIDTANNQIRVPDYNGRQSGSIGPVVFRADGTLGFAPGTIRQDQFQGHKMRLRAGGGSNAGSGAETAPIMGGTTDNSSGGTVGSLTTQIVSDAVNGAPRTGTETFPTHVVGVWGVVLFGEVINAGAADAAVLATSYADQQSRIAALETKKFKWQRLPDIALSASAPFSFSHTLGFIPQFMNYYYRCISADAGYAVGATVYPQDLKYDAAGTTIRGLLIKVLSADTCSGIIASTGPVLINNTTNANVSLSFASWVLVITLGGTSE